MDREQIHRQQRKLKFDNIQFRAETTPDGVKYLKGYPILFNVPGTPYRGSKWKEIIDPNALVDIDLSDLRMLVDHDTSLVLARAGKNMTYNIDNIGLFVAVELPNTQLANDTYELVNLGIVDGMSFSFMADIWQTDSEQMVDTILHFTDIPEVSVVTFPAYEQTVVIADTTPANAGNNTNTNNNSNVDNGIDDLKKQALINLINSL